MDLRIICPGLLGPYPAFDRPLGALPALDRLLQRADRQPRPERDPLESLASTFGLVRPERGDLPSAPLSLLADDPRKAVEGYWLHADPVHLRADRDRLLLFAGPSLGIEDSESRALADAFNAHFGADGLSLLVTAAGRWYLRVASPPGVATTPVHRVAGGPVDPHLPRGAGASAWARLQTEAQMLFHGHGVNQARESAGRPVISGLWTWGGGSLPRLPDAPNRLVVADHPFARGLASAATAESVPLGGWVPGKNRAPAEVLVFWDRLWWPGIEGDSDRWLSAVIDLDTFLASAVSALGSGGLRAIVLEDGGGTRFETTRLGLRRFWRRRGGLAAWIDRTKAPV